MKLKVLNSQIDSSVNFIEEALAGFLEARYVKRPNADYFIAYLSSHNGCKMGCSMCFLTQTKQFSFIDSTMNDYISQALQIFKHHRKVKDKTILKWASFNFMARGEPLSNQTLLDSGDELLSKLGQVAKEEGLPAKFNISTIMPLTLKKSLPEIFNYIHPTIYYSIYSTDPTWRKKWLPAAMEVDQAMSLLKEYQNLSKKSTKLHFAMIKGENDSEENIHSICDLVDKHKLMCEFNLVRYNPYSAEQGEESSEEVIERNMNIFRDRFKFNGKVQMVQRVGFDVKASCGTFFE